MRRSHFRSCLSAAMACLVLGCGPSGPPTYPVHGSVMLDGEPVAKGSIAFIPEDGHGPTAGGEITGGKYSTQLQAGVKKVQIRVPRKVGEAPRYSTPDSPMDPIFEEAAPPQYNDETTLKVTITSTTKVQNFEMTSK